jgi:hypothetical protein
MGRKNQNTYLKKQKEDKKRKKKEQKRKKMEFRKSQDTSSDLKDMLAYVDEDGNLTSDPPDEDQVTDKI